MIDGAKIGIGTFILYFDYLSQKLLNDRWRCNKHSLIYDYFCDSKEEILYFECLFQKLLLYLKMIDGALINICKFTIFFDKN